MDHKAAGAETHNGGGFEQTIGRAFLTAHLLTGSIQRAEGAVLEAIDSFDPDRDSEDRLFSSALHASVYLHAEDGLGSGCNRPEEVGFFLPAELHAVLKLSPQARRCFVLRVLHGLPVQACARLLDLNVRKVDGYTCAALQSLAGFDPIDSDNM